MRSSRKRDRNSKNNNANLPRADPTKPYYKFNNKENNSFSIPPLASGEKRLYPKFAPANFGMNFTRKAPISSVGSKNLGFFRNARAAEWAHRGFKRINRRMLDEGEEVLYHMEDGPSSMVKVINTGTVPITHTVYHVLQGVDGGKVFVVFSNTRVREWNFFEKL